MRAAGLNALTGLIAGVLISMASVAMDRGIVTTVHATETEQVAIPLPRPRPVVRVPRPRLSSFPGKTEVMELESAPFPYDGKNPSTGKPFFDVFYDGRFGRRGVW